MTVVEAHHLLAMIRRVDEDLELFELLIEVGVDITSLCDLERTLVTHLKTE